MEQCSQFFEENLGSFGDVMEVRNLAVTNGCTDLITAVDSFMGDNFSEISASPNFLEYSLANILNLINIDNLRQPFTCVLEKDIYNAVIKWTKHDFKSRSPNLEMLLGSIQLSRLSADFIEDTVKPFLKANDKCLPCLKDLENTDENAEAAETVIIALGEYCPVIEGDVTAYGTRNLELFDFKNEKWISWMNIEERFFGLLSFGNFIAFYDICNQMPYEALIYDIKKSKFNHSKINIPMHNELVALDGRFYAIGMLNGDRSAKVLEEGNWKIGANMSAVKRPAASVVAHDGRIYVFGGLRDQTAEVYDPVKDEWESIPPMSTARIGAGAASLGGKIFVVGGNGANNEYLASCECYDPKTKVWTRIPDMIHVRGDTEAVATDGALIVAERYRVCNVI